MNQVAAKFEELRAQGRKALIPFIMAGDPDISVTSELLPVLEESGADLIELGVPFSDPLADGPVIQAAAQRALDNGFKVKDLFPLISQVRTKVTVPIILLVYYNLLLQYGLERFLTDASLAGVDGLVIPDLPPEEAGELIASARVHRIAVNFLVAPTSTTERLKKAAELSTGFIYLVSVRGVTGERTTMSEELPELVRSVKNITNLPVAVGFGISTPEQAKEASNLADGIIVGSAIVRRMSESSPSMVALNVGGFMKTIRKACY